MTKEALMYCCQSAPGAGHIQRALALAGELSEHFEVTLVLSKRPAETVAAPDGVKLVFLGALEADPESNLKQRSSARRDTILRIFDSLRPRVLAIDSFPFPGYPLHEDFLALVKEARSDHHGESLVACVTDGILANDAPNNEALANRAADILDRYFDIVIVRSDPIFARLEEFFRPKNNVRTPLYHTGFIAPERSDLRPSAGRSRNGIVVSAGDGLSGMALYKCAIEAHRTLRHILPIPMTIIAGRRLSEDNWQALQSLADGQPALSLRRTSPTLAAEMEAARWSISQCDYGTAVDVIRTRTPSLFVPSADKNYRKQIERAKRLVYWGAGRLLMPHHLNTASLVNEIHQLTKFEARRLNFELNGAHNAAQLIEQVVYQNSHKPVSTQPSIDKRPH